MGATTKRYDTTPAQTSQLRGGIVDYLMGGNKGGGASGFGTQGNGTGSPYDRINAHTAAPTQSIDQLGGADSEFFKNMIARYQPAFDQNRNLAIAGAKEGAGTLTGSGFANILGTNINRSLADQNNTLTGIASHGMDLEAQRQAQRYGAETGVNQQNASNFLQLLMGQGLAGVGPDTIKTSGGIGALLGPLASLAGLYFGHGGGIPGLGGGGPSPTGGSPSSGSGGPLDPFAYRGY